MEYFFGRPVCHDCTVHEDTGTVMLCPLHAAAGEMLEALRWCSQNLSGGVCTEDRDALKRLIDKSGENSLDGTPDLPQGNPL